MSSQVTWMLGCISACPAPSRQGTPDLSQTHPTLLTAAVTFLIHAIPLSPLSFCVDSSVDQGEVQAWLWAVRKILVVKNNSEPGESCHESLSVRTLLSSPCFTLPHFHSLMVNCEPCTPLLGGAQSRLLLSMLCSKHITLKIPPGHSQCCWPCPWVTSGQDLKLPPHLVASCHSAAVWSPSSATF